MWNSSNPALKNDDAFSQYYGRDMFASGASSASVAKPNVTTLQGVVNKTTILVSIAVAAGAVGYWALRNMPGLVMISAIASFAICLGFGWLLCGKPQLARVFGPLYAVVEGIFLGALTAVADSILASQEIKVAGGVGVQAFIVTSACMVSMLMLYKAGLVRATPTLKTIVSVATGGIMLAYLVSFVLSFFGMPLPLISFASAVSDSGAIGLLGLGINLFILGIASLWLVIDFSMIEEKLNAGAPKYMEWYCAYALLLTLAWIYYESVKLVVRLAVLFGDRD